MNERARNETENGRKTGGSNRVTRLAGARFKAPPFYGFSLGIDPDASVRRTGDCCCCCCYGRCCCRTRPGKGKKKELAPACICTRIVITRNVLESVSVPYLYVRLMYTKQRYMCTRRALNYRRKLPTGTVKYPKRRRLFRICLVYIHAPRSPCATPPNRSHTCRDV